MSFSKTELLKAFARSGANPLYKDFAIETYESMKTFAEHAAEHGWSVLRIRDELISYLLGVVVGMALNDKIPVEELLNIVREQYKEWSSHGAS
jgi:KaiC/GvpD/RAD55 family RecA-like ATPase